VPVTIAARAEYRRLALLRDAEKMVRLTGRLQRVDRDRQRAIGPVLEPDRCREPARHLAMGLRLGGTGADRGPADELRKILRHDRIERLGRGGDLDLREVQQQLAREPDALLDLERVVHVGVVDEPLPADRRARLLEVDAHQHDHRALDSLHQRLQAIGVLTRCDEVVDRAGTDDDEQARVFPLEDPPQGAARPVHEFLGLGRHGHARLDGFGRRQELARDDVDVVETVLHWPGLTVARIATVQYAARAATVSHIDVRTDQSSGKNLRSSSLAR
jgi:hypothetical protein